MPTRTIGTWENGTVTAELDFDASNIATNLRVINNSALDVFIQVQEIASGRSVSRTFAANSGTMNQAIPTGVGQRLTQFINANGKFDGLSISARIPA